MNEAQKRVDADAEQRIEESLAQRTSVLNEVMVKGNRITAEPSMARRLRVIAERVGVTGLRAEKIAAGVDPRIIESLSKAQVQAALALQGKSSGALPVVTLEKARTAAHAVGRLLAGERSIGTCFMISRELLITNHHVLQDANEAAACEVEFNFEVNERGNRRRTTRFALAPEVFWQTDHRTHRDFSVVALGERKSGSLTRAKLGFCQLSAARNKHALGDFVNLVQHPGQQPKQVVMRDTLLVHRGQNVLLYNADTEEGTSGSPVFNDWWQVVALHHFAGTSQVIRLENGVVLPHKVNEGIRASRIATELLERRPAMSPDQRTLLERAIDSSVDVDTDDTDDEVPGAPPLANAA